MSERTTINGVKLFWERTGNAGEPLVLVHGSWVDHRNWDAVVPLLSHHFRVLTYDRRGHSQSERPTGQGSIREDVADLAALIEELRLAPVHIAGHSFGGSIALRLAQERPDLVRSLIAHEPPLLNLLADEPDGAAIVQSVNERVAAITDLLEAGDMEGGVRQFVETIAFGPGEWEHVPPEVREIVIFNAPTFLDELREPQAYSIDLASLRAFSRPVLVTYGEQSPPIFQTIAKKVASALPNAEQKVYSGAGHEPEQSHPEEYVATVTDFITRVASAQDIPSARPAPPERELEGHP